MKDCYYLEIMVCMTFLHINEKCRFNFKPNNLQCYIGIQKLRNIKKKEKIVRKFIIFIYLN